MPEEIIKKTEKKKFFQGWGKVFLNTFLVLFAGFLGVIIYLIVLAADLPSLTELQQFNPDSVSKIMSADGKLIKELYIFKRDVVRIGAVPKDLLNALISMEDRNFYRHSGMSVRGIVRAIVMDIATLSKGQGASTISQQLARNMYNTIGFKKTILRKIKELLTAIQIEKTYTKAEIMELYLNSVYFGHGAYGVQSASKIYFGKDISELGLDECAILVGLLPAPARYSPINHPEKAIDRRNLVLRVTRDRGYISDQEYENTLALPLAQKDSVEKQGEASYFAEYIRRELEKIDEELDINLYKDGLIIHTTLDMEIQQTLSKVFDEGILNNQEILNKEYLKDRDKLEFALQQAKSGFSIDSVRQILSSDTLLIPWELRNQFLVQGAAIVLNPLNGHILGMIGGRQEDEYADHFNRATQAVRQPGSVFKPFIYLTALENNYKPTTQLLNQPIQVCLDEACKDKWNPGNHDGSTGGMTTLRDGIRRSLNLISVRVVQELVTPREVRKNAREFGITTRLDAVEAIALGSSGVIPLEITSAYAAIANNGILTTPIGITRIEDRYGRVIQDFSVKSNEIKDEAVIYLLRDMMRSVVDDGTGGSLRWKYRFTRPAAGKTGTTNSKADAWFVGFTPQLAMGVWVGMDDPAISLGKSQFGSQAALPIWARAIKGIYEVKDYPLAGWDRPEGIVEVEICTDTYELVSQWCPRDSRTTEIFLFDAQPRMECSAHSNPFTRFKN